MLAKHLLNLINLSNCNGIKLNRILKEHWLQSSLINKTSIFCSKLQIWQMAYIGVYRISQMCSYILSKRDSLQIKVYGQIWFYLPRASSSCALFAYVAIRVNSLGTHVHTALVSTVKKKQLNAVFVIDTFSVSLRKSPIFSDDDINELNYQIPNQLKNNYNYPLT